MEKYKSRNKFSETDELPDTLQELEEKFNIVHPHFSLGNRSGECNNKITIIFMHH